ncbi:MAG: hypothetical protein ACRELY_10380 [Polyangiaceae bacterium]
MHNAKVVLSFLVLGALAGCSSSSSPVTSSGDSGTSGGGSGTLKITSPSAGATVTIAKGATDVGFTTTNFTLMAPGSCAGAVNCGHIHVLIDSSACNDTAGGLPYNVAATASPAQPNFDLCPTPTGAHTITLELHNDDHSPYQVNGVTVSDQVAVTTTGT